MEQSAEGSVEQSIAALAAVSSLLSPAQHAECNTEEMLATALSEASARAHEVVAHPDATFQQAMQDGQLACPGLHVAAIKRLAASVWLDRHLLECRHASES